MGGDITSNKLIVIDNLSNYIYFNKKKKINIKKSIKKGIFFSCIFLIIRAILILPMFIFSEENIGFLEAYIERYNYFNYDYEQIFNKCKELFSMLYLNHDFLVKYMIISFVLLSIVLIIIIKSPVGILISFILIGLSPYIMQKILIPFISFVYIPISSVNIFVDNLFPFIPAVLTWGILGFVFGIKKAKNP